MARRDVSVIASGRRYRLGRTADEGVIWRKRPWGWRVVARYPLTDEGWRVASGQFAMWEPQAEQSPADPFSRSPTDETSPRDDVPPGATTPPRIRWIPPSWVWILGVVVLLWATAGALFAGGVLDTSSRSPSARTTSSLPAVGSGYLAKGSAWIVYVQWTDHHGLLSGSLQEVTATGEPPTETVSSTTITVSGVITGRKISLSFNSGPDHFGVLTSHGFTINFRIKSGLLVPMRFREASTRQYNLAVAHLHTEVAHTNTAAAAAQQVAALRTSINKAATQVETDLAALSTAEPTLAKDVGAVASALQGEGARLSTTQQAEQAVLSQPKGPTSNVCTAADEVATDSNVVDTAKNEVGTAVNVVTSDLTSGYSTSGLRQLMSALSSALTNYQTAQSKLPTYRPASTLTASGVQKALASATAAGATAAATTNGYVNQANAEAKAGVQYADATSSAGGCGWSQPTPAPVGALSWSGG